MILADAITNFANAPLTVTLMALTGASGAGILGFILRMLVLFTRIDSKVDTALTGINDIKTDKDIVRWSGIAQRDGKLMHIHADNGDAT